VRCLRWHDMVVIGCACGILTFGLLGWMSEDRESCARMVTGQVHVLDDLGRDAVVEHTWCAEWKPGRGPDAGGEK
jgi:hypothetical protein